MRNLTELEPHERRVVGALMEKQQTTPEYYPLTLKALQAACNQKSNRNPALSLREIEVLNILRVLLQERLVERTSGARVDRWGHRVGDSLSAGARAILTLLLLRGPQTIGELRGRCERLHSFDSLADAISALQQLSQQDPPLAVELTRHPGQKENRWAFPAQGEELQAAPLQPEPQPAPTAAPWAERLERLEELVEKLQQEVQALKDQLEID
ncbi:MAG: DUF480 domain-containing protein [Acidobacteriota bacterium]